MRHLISLAVLFALHSPASASTPAAWAALEREAKRSCLAASELRRPHVSRAVIFDDTVGKLVLVITGTYAEPRLRGVRGTNLCLYDRRTRKAAVEEAKGWSAPQ